MSTNDTNEQVIKSINYNWHAYQNQNGGGEDFYTREVGKEYNGLKCVEIEQHAACGEGDKWFYDIHFSDGSVVRIFNPSEVNFLPPSEMKF